MSVIPFQGTERFEGSDADVASGLPVTFALGLWIENSVKLVALLAFGSCSESCLLEMSGSCDRCS